MGTRRWGNFLYIAYQELKRIEQLLLDKITEQRRSPRQQLEMSFVTPLQFVEDASDHVLPFEYIKATVKPERDKNRREVTKINWWKYGEKRPAMRNAIASLSCYFTVSIVSKWAVFIPAPLNWLPGDLNIVVGPWAPN
jgi:hypothetical protein